MEEQIPHWLLSFQADFGALLRTPLDRSSGALRAEIERYPAALVGLATHGPRAGPAERLAVYHRQYWFRLFTALQDDFPLVARLLGFWTFNGWADRFLAAHAPSSADLARLGDGFTGFLARELPPDIETPGGPLPRLAVLQAAAVDQAYRQVLSSPLEPTLTPAEVHAAGGGLQLRLSRSFQLVEEHWALAALRQSLSDSGATDARLPDPHPAPRWLLIGRVDRVLVRRELPDLQAALLRELQVSPLESALEALEARCPPEELERLPSLVQGWMEEGMRLGLWLSAAPPEPPAAVTP